MGMLREGYTTGTCAAAAVAAAVKLLEDGTVSSMVKITVPAKKTLSIETFFLSADDSSASFAVYKDSGDDPDCTNGCKVIAEIFLRGIDGDITFTAGEGVGTVTKAGLAIAVGEAAINPIPRLMIEQEVRRVFPIQAVIVRISIEHGEILAKKTMNQRLGIIGGLSVLGTTGLVRPMSAQALIDTIKVEIDLRLAHTKNLVFVFGAMGENALLVQGYSQDQMVQISNYVGEALDYLADKSVDSLLVAGHTGKMIKVAGGIFQTHSRQADARAEILCAHAALLGANHILLQELFDCTTTVAADQLLKKSGLRVDVWQQIANASKKRIQMRLNKNVPISTILLDQEGMVCGQSEENET